MSTPRLLVVDAYPRRTRAALMAAGSRRGAELYADTLLRFAPDAEITKLFAADADAALPAGSALADFDGVAWTGSSLSLCDAGTAEVDRQVDLARQVFAAGVPSFGSCWAAQVHAVAAGGAVARNPRGREIGVARKVTLTPDGRAHPLYLGKPAIFDTLASHEDEIVRVPDTARVLATNAMSRVQAIEITSEAGNFWGFQYHPEFDLGEVARIMAMRLETLVAQGFFADRAAGLQMVADLEALHRDPGRHDLAWRYGIDADVLDADRRLREVGNWVRERVLTRARAR